MQVKSLKKISSEIAGKKTQKNTFWCSACMVSSPADGRPRAQAITGRGSSLRVTSEIRRDVQKIPY